MIRLPHAHFTPVIAVPVGIAAEEQAGQDDLDQASERGADLRDQRAVAEQLSAQGPGIANVLVLQFANARNPGD